MYILEAMMSNQLGETMSAKDRLQEVQSLLEKRGVVT
jgi:hypothetical protein